MNDAIKILAATPPPPPIKKSWFANVGKAAARIRELETAAGLPTSKPIWNIVQANRRVQELETLLAQKQHSAPTAAPPRTAPTPVQSNLPSREQQIAIARVLGINVGLTGSEISAAKLWDNIQKEAYQAHVSIPGMDSDAELAKTFWRPDASKITGTARYIRSRLQEKINNVLEGGN